MTPNHDLTPLEGLDALDEERAADMVYNRPHYGTATSTDPEWNITAPTPPQGKTETASGSTLTLPVIDEDTERLRE